MTNKNTSVTVPLAYPVTVDGRDYAELRFRRMKARDTLIAESEPNQARAGFLIFAALAGVDVEVIEELDLADLETIGDKVAPLMGKSGAAALEEAQKVPKERVSSGAT